MVGLCLGEIRDALVEELERSIACCRLAQQSKFIFLIVANDGNLAHLFGGILHHVMGNGYDAFGQTAGQRRRIEAVVVLHHNAA